MKVCEISTKDVAMLYNPEPKSFRFGYISSAEFGIGSHATMNQKENSPTFQDIFSEYRVFNLNPTYLSMFWTEHGVSARNLQHHERTQYAVVILSDGSSDR